MSKRMSTFEVGIRKADGDTYVSSSRVTQISYQRVFNLGNFEAERIELVASVDADDSVRAVFMLLKASVNRLHELKEDKADE